MVHAGAPLFFWIWSVESAVFISNIAATYSSREKIWSTPYTLVFGEPFPDASVVVPFGCGALILLDKEDRAKFKTRCALMLFVHYATNHPLYTYAFYSPKLKRVIYRQDAIFFVTVFPMRHARTQSGSSDAGDPLVAFRSPLASAMASNDELSFHTWQPGDALPDYEDHATGLPLTEDYTSTRLVTPEVPLDWPRRYPYHPSFGHRSTVPVPVPTLFPTDSPFLLEDAIPTVPVDDDAIQDLDPFPFPPGPRLHDDLSESSSDSEDSTPAYTTRDRDKDLSRGTDHHLRLPVPVVSPGLKRRHSLTTSDGSLVVPDVVPLPADSVVPPPAPVPDPPPMTRVLRPRRSARLPAASSPPAIAPRVPVHQRWFYESVPPSSPADPATHDPLPHHPTDDPQLHADVAAFMTTLSSSSISGLPPLVPRQSWMLDEDDRTDAKADSDWHLANRSLDSGSLEVDPKPFTPTVPHLTQFHAAAMSQGLLPLVQLETGSGFMDFPRPKALYLNSKIVRRILAARESIFKYGIYLPRNDRDADASPERARWHSGRQLEWIRLKDVKAFEYDWTKERNLREHPTYLPSEIGHLFYIYDYKFSGEHRVRLVFDGSRRARRRTMRPIPLPSVRSPSVCSTSTPSGNGMGNSSI
jgi:hypothetical protein